MKTKILFSVFIFFSLSTYACSCDWGGNFIKAASFSDAIVNVKIIYSSWGHNTEGFAQVDEAPIPFIVVNIIEAINGVEKRKEIKIYGSDGVDCFDDLSQFKVGKTYILSINERSQTKLIRSNGQDKVYGLWGCSEHWLEYSSENNSVYGMIKGKSLRKSKRFYNYDTLLTKLK